jgi:Uma2 family endonuclease
VLPNGPLRHAILAANLGNNLIHALVGRRFSVQKNDELLSAAPIRVGHTFLYPDLCVTRDEPQPILNPTVLIEIVSRPSEAADRGMKFARYRTIESLAE